jgi:hypothetical protein
MVMAVVRAGIVLILIGLLSPRVFATCGDWLAHPDGLAADSASSAEESGAATAPRSDNSHGAPRPCHGPFCGKSPTAPAAPAPIQIPTASDHVVATLVRLAATGADDRDSALAAQHDAAPLAGHSRRIDHPPQA